MSVSYYADPSVWGQRSWPGLAGATGEQMRTVGAWFNLAKHYGTQYTAVPGKGKLNFSHCASDPTLQIRHQMSNGNQKQDLDIKSAFPSSRKTKAKQY